ncbi:MAG: hypothetical protein ACPG4N_09985 [Gammaproteobacteria bacterium]
MNQYKISKSMRLFFTVSGTVIWLGIWLSGFSTVHWLLYIPAVFFAFAVLTGICPGMIISKALLKSD